MAEPERETAELEATLPEPPPMQRRVRVRWQQAVGLALLAVGPIAALAGAIDEHEQTTTRAVGPLAVRVAHVDRVRQNRTGRVALELRHDGDEPVAVEVAISPEYFEGAHAVQTAPPPVRAWMTQLPRVEPGDRTRVEVEYEAEHPGWYEGTLRLRVRGLRGGDVHEARVPLATYVHF